MKDINDYFYNRSLNTTVLLDVRRIDDYLIGHLLGSLSCPLEKISSFHGDYKKRYLVYCNSGNRSELAVRYLKFKGYNAINIGGILDFKGELIKGDKIRDFDYLEVGDQIDLIAPSFGCVIEPYKTRLKYAINNLKEDGFIINEGPNIYLSKSKGRSNTPQNCALEFNNAYLNSPSKAIFSVGGGELMCEILPFIDFEHIKLAKPKIFMGFSDNCNLTYTLTTICNIKTVYGVNAGAFFLKPYANSEKDSLDLIMGKKKLITSYPLWEEEKPVDYKINPLVSPNLNKKIKIKNYPDQDIEIEGIILGGNLDVLSNLCGTRFDKTIEFINKHKDDGIIWYLESCDLNTMSIKRALFELKEAGWFNYVKGFIFGRPLTYLDQSFGLNYLTAIKSTLKDLYAPLILDASIGHFYPSLPIINGSKVKVVSKNNQLTIEYLD